MASCQLALPSRMVRFFRERQRLRSLSERECYARLHGHRSDDVRLRPIVSANGREPDAENGNGQPAPLAPVSGPNRDTPALDLVLRYPRGGVTISGEELRRDLLARIERRTERRDGP